MNNCNCGRHLSNETCFESRLSLGVKNDKSAIIGSLDRQSITPIPMKPVVQANETVTTLRYDPDKRSLVYTGEAAKRTNGSSDYVSAREILSGADISEIGGVGKLVDGGIPTVSTIDGTLQLEFTVPDPIETGEISSGFLTYVATPNTGSGHLKTIRPDTNSTTDSILIGRADGSISFSAPLDSPILIPASRLKTGGIFNGAPAVASGTWRYQQMGTSDVISNTSGSTVEVALGIRFSLVTTGSHSGVYCRLTAGGADYKTTFIEGVTDIRQEGYPGGYAQFSVMLAPNEKCAFDFGAWTNAAGNMECTIGGLTDVSGTMTKVVYLPTIKIRRSI